MSAPFRVELLVFAGLRQRLGRPSLALELPAGCTVAQLRAQLERTHPELGALTHCRLAVDHEFVDDATIIPAGAELALIPPVSGGHDGAASHLSEAPLELARVVAAVEHEGAGGITTFTGAVRRHSRGKTVDHLEYEAYAPMALAVMDRIARGIEAEIRGTRVCIHHRIGRLEVGEIAVIIAASAPHRAEAFDACRRAIEALKREVPIWKKEVDEAGEAWIGQGP